MLRDTFVHPLVPATNQHEAILPHQLLRYSLGKEPSLWRKQDHGEAPARRSSFQRGDRFENRHGLENHSGPAPEGPVIHGSVAVLGEVTQVMQPDAGLAAGNRALEHAVFQYTPEEVREDGDNVKRHAAPVARASRLLGYWKADRCFMRARRPRYAHAFKSNKSSGGSMKIVLASVSIFVQMAWARGIRTSPRDVATRRTSTPPVGSISVTVPTSTCLPPLSVT